MQIIQHVELHYITFNTYCSLIRLNTELLKTSKILEIVMVVFSVLELGNRGVCLQTENFMEIKSLKILDYGDLLV